MVSRAKMKAWMAPMKSSSKGFQIKSPIHEAKGGISVTMTAIISTPEKMLPKSRNVSVIGLVISSMMLIGVSAA